MATAIKDLRESKEVKSPKPLPAPNSDFYELAETLNPEELALVKQVRAFMESKVAPIINKYWSDDAFPFELIPPFKELNLGGLGINGYGCRGGSQKMFGFIMMELARVDPSFSTFYWSARRSGHGLHLPRRLRRAETEVAAADGAPRKDRLFRPDRAARRLRSSRRPTDHRQNAKAILGSSTGKKGEVEALSYTHLAVPEAAGFGIPDPHWGQLVLACVVLKPGRSLSTDDLIAHYRRRLANYKIPRRIEFRETELPKSGSGKILKRILRERFWVKQERAVS